MRILGLDFGSKTIGVAVSGETGGIAVGVETLRREREENLKANVHRIGDLIKEYNIGIIVLGFPKNMDGSLSERCEKTLVFKDRLERTFKKVKVDLQDERLTSVQAEKAMAFAGVKSRRRKEIVDEGAAVIILQTYLDRIRLESENNREGEGFNG
ncbi:MAG: Holliday junction resolvase RuvX [Clostridiales bacterium]|nr:Holliday junction resolvase RuvX [Clostridiales bacterium]